ncbi:AAA domain-containing protein [Nodularia sp. UHCC 0506]|uniref:AAA domain-containing protein n=1 Tax=Nodularia sp. UHCC 0506 TaxID=3110243 RepID=UPI002B21D083|nr:AAA domain-containing protein [Nodularia sp. UHCC 0506]MEA5513294.1 AAA domain-containing protein [Nodularia sp. UHCC 0506]
MRYIPKAESYDRRGTRRKLYCIIAGSAVVTHLSVHKSDFQIWCLYNQVCSELTQNHLTPLVEAHRQGEIELEDIHKVLSQSILRPWFVKNFDTQPALCNFEGEEQRQKIDKFRQLQKQYFQLCRDFIRSTLAEKLPGNNVVFAGSEIGTLKKENQKQKGHISIRSLFNKIPNLLPRLKPCFLMSPLSVAQYLPADGTQFDLVVFDEASQLETHESIGAIARGKQVIIVGDSKQMPPTKSFTRTDSDSIPDEDDLVDLESLLDEAIASQFPEQMLQWHYRSRHETLIDFSNKNYYDGKLNIFPAANSFSPELGLKWHHIPDGFYQTGERTNRREAEALVEFLVRQLQTYQRDKRTFGVITFSMPQKVLINELLDEARRTYPDIEPHFDKEFSERVFIKNLENVQGDERDEIIFSICYAPTQNGQMSMRFGNLNNAGGERRLNVAVTRVRLSLRIFSTITGSQIDLNRTNAIGASHLKDFLEFAEKSGTPKATQFLRTNDFDSDIEKEIYQALVNMGYTVNCKIGCGDYRIDLAVIHPRQPGVYMLGIETDGKTYQSAATVQDRELVRPSVLASLNWRIHRIWSLDWRLKREQELARLKQTLETAIQEFSQVEIDLPLISSSSSISNVKTNKSQPDKLLISNVKQAELSEIIQPNETALIKSSHVKTTPAESNNIPSHIIPYQIAELKVVTTDNQLIYNNESIPLIKEKILSVAAVEAPILIVDIVRAVSQCWSFNMVSKKLTNCITEQVKQLVNQKQLWCEQDFIWTSKEQWQNWQFVRQPVDNKKRKIEQIPVEELAVATKWIISQSLSIGEEDLYKAIASLFSLGRLNDQTRLKMSESVTLVCNQGKAKRDSSRVVWIN